MQGDCFRDPVEQARVDMLMIRQSLLAMCALASWSSSALAKSAICEVCLEEGEGSTNVVIHLSRWVPYRHRELGLFHLSIKLPETFVLPGPGKAVGYGSAGSPQLSPAVDDYYRVGLVNNFRYDGSSLLVGLAMPYEIEKIYEVPHENGLLIVTELRASGGGASFPAPNELNLWREKVLCRWDDGEERGELGSGTGVDNWLDDGPDTPPDEAAHPACAARLEHWRRAANGEDVTGLRAPPLQGELSAVEELRVRYLYCAETAGAMYGDHQVMIPGAQYLDD